MLAIGASFLLAITNCTAVHAWSDCPGGAQKEALFSKATADEVDEASIGITNRFASFCTDFLGTGTEERTMSFVEMVARALRSTVDNVDSPKGNRNSDRARPRTRTFEQLEPRMMMSVAQDANGWTVVTPSADSRIIYVSDSTGNNANDGLSAATAKKTIAAGEALLRAGMPDHLLLKRGDTFTNQTLGDNSIPNGRSAQEPIYIGTYGSGARPQILTGSSKGYNDVGTFTNIVIQGLYLRPHTRTDSTSDLSGIEVNANCTNLIIEDCYITEFQSGLILQGSGTNIQIRRNSIVDSYISSSAGYSSGFFTYGFSELLLEENLFDHNGWKTGVANNNPWFNHNIYISSSPSMDLTVRGNILSRSTGVSFSAIPKNGTVTFTNNLIVGSGYQGNIGATDVPPASGLVLTFQNNVITEGGGPNGYGDGSGFTIQNIESGTISNNIIANLAYPGTADYSFKLTDDGANPAYGVHNLVFENNVQYNYRAPLKIWKPPNGTITGVQVRDNYFQEPNVNQNNDPAYLLSQRSSSVTYSANTYFRGGSTDKWFENNGVEVFETFAQWKSTVEPTAVQQKLDFFDPTRTTVTYAALFGLTSFDALMAEMRQQSQADWRTEFTADAVNDYIRAGFAVDPIGIPVLPDPNSVAPPAASTSTNSTPPPTPSTPSTSAPPPALSIPSNSDPPPAPSSPSTSAPPPALSTSSISEPPPSPSTPLTSAPPPALVYSSDLDPSPVPSQQGIPDSVVLSSADLREPVNPSSQISSHADPVTAGAQRHSFRHFARDDSGFDPNLMLAWRARNLAIAVVSEKVGGASRFASIASGTDEGSLSDTVSSASDLPRMSRGAARDRAFGAWYHHGH